MIKNSTVLVVCFAGASLSASEKKAKDIYTIQDLNTEIKRAREEYQKNKHVTWNDCLTRGNKINHEPTPVNTVSDTQKK